MKSYLTQGIQAIFLEPSEAASSRDLRWKIKIFIKQRLYIFKIFSSKVFLQLPLSGYSFVFTFVTSIWPDIFLSEPIFTENFICRFFIESSIFVSLLNLKLKHTTKYKIYLWGYRGPGLPCGLHPGVHCSLHLPGLHHQP